jgi:16S rRNA (guanine527-N7)-methyltransferase
MQNIVGGVNVSRETMAALHVFSDLVLKWTPSINLIGAATKSTIWDRHIVDSAQIFQHAPANFTTWVDIGSGGGFPGIVAAILGQQFAPEAKFILIESDQRKAMFLRTAIRELALNATVVADRIEKADPAAGDIVSARALGALTTILPLINRHLKPNGVALLHKGRQADQEIAQAQQDWTFDLAAYASMTDPEARLLVIQRISRVG